MILTVCAGDPPTTSVSSFAQGLQARWAAPADPVGLRRQEDRNAAVVLGARAVHLEIPDAIYRVGPRGEALYASEEAIFGPPHPADFALADGIRSALREVIPWQAETYAPLAAGGHVDHRITRRAAERLSRRLAFYEDYPYAALYGQVEFALAGADWLPESLPLTEGDLQAWMQAVACYHSQLSTFWPDVGAMQAALREHARRPGARAGLAHRFWRKT